MGLRTCWWDVVSGHLSSSDWAKMGGQMGKGIGNGIGACRYPPIGPKGGNPAGGIRFSSLSLAGSWNEVSIGLTSEPRERSREGVESAVSISLAGGGGGVCSSGTEGGSIS